MRRVLAYYPPFPAPVLTMPAAHFTQRDAETIVGLRRLAGDDRLLSSFRADCLRQAQTRAVWVLAPELWRPTPTGGLEVRS